MFPLKFCSFLIHNVQIVIIIIGHRIAWRFGGGQGIWLGFAFVPTFELVGLTTCCVSVWQGATLFKGVWVTVNYCLFPLRKSLLVA